MTSRPPRLALALLALCLASPAVAAKAPRARGTNARTGRATPPFSELVKAAKKNDRAALERLAGRMGVARLAEAARGTDLAVARAAMAAIPLARGGVLLAGTVADRLDAAGDPELVVAAAQTVGALLEGDVPSRLTEWEVPPDVVARACGGLRALAVRADAAATLRLAALDALATAQPTCPVAELSPLLRDPSPAVRRAVALVLRPSDASQAAALRAGMGDLDPTVSSACAATVCGRVDPAAPRKKADPLVEQATATARSLVVAPATPPEDVVEMLACLAAAGTPADRASLARLRQGGPPPVRERAAELTGGAAPPANKTE